jgi:hypothetical protein
MIAFAAQARRFISYSMTKWIQNESLNHWKEKLLKIWNIHTKTHYGLFDPILYISFEI